MICYANPSYRSQQRVRKTDMEEQSIMIKAAIMGHGTVGSGVYEVFEMNAEKIARVVGEPVEVKYVLDLRDFPRCPTGINLFPTFL